MYDISVIVPVYGAEKYLHECVDSIINQSHKNIEIILVDDGSKDNCPAICDEYARKDSRVRVVHKENGGFASARNAGLDIAQGTFIGFVDADDYIMPNMYESLLTNIMNYNADVAECGILCNPLYSKRNQVLRNDEIIKWYSTWSRSNVCWNKLYRRDIIENNNLRFVDYRIAEDKEFTIRYYINCKTMIYIALKLYYYRPGGATSIFDKSVKIHKKIISDITDEILEVEDECNTCWVNVKPVLREYYLINRLYYGIFTYEVSLKKLLSEMCPLPRADIETLDRKIKEHFGKVFFSVHVSLKRKILVFIKRYLKFGFYMYRNFKALIKKIFHINI